VFVKHFSYEYELLAVASSGTRNALKVHSNTLATQTQSDSQTESRLHLCRGSVIGGLLLL